MFLYAIIAAIAAVVAGIILAACTKKAEGLVYGKLDKAGRITNVLLIPIYAFTALFCIALSLFSNPAYDGFLGFLGLLVAILVASTPLFCGVSLGISAKLRKKGKSRASFAVQFAGLAGAVISIALYMVCYGNLLKPLN